MSPLKIKMLLHYYASARDYRDEEPACRARSPAVTEALEDMQCAELIMVTNPGWGGQNTGERRSEWSVTDKGRAMVEHLCAVKVPVCKWVQPAVDLPASYPFSNSGGM